MKRTGLCGLIVALAITWAGCSDDAATGNENNNNGIAVCGNGIVEPDNGETCDNGAANSDTEPNACRSSCQVASCGDGVQDNGEDCDGDDLDGAICSDLPPLNHGSLSCNLDCTFDTEECFQCGDGVINPGEECDGDALGFMDTEPSNCGNITGKPDGVLACLTDCTHDISDCALCGDGLIEGPEECDDASDNSDQPNATCRLNCTPALCGDGIQDDNTPRFEQCDCGLDPLALPLGCNTININNVPNACKSDCTAPACGDGIVDNGSPWYEVCDDGPNNCPAPGCTCASNCTLPGCGNGILEGAEECDCGLDPLNLPGLCNTINTNTTLDASCNQACKEPRCGNLVIDATEECDHGDGNNCDDGTCACASNCTLPGCGNQITEAHRGEECDLGVANCDSAGCLCNLDCTVPRCGNGYPDPGEECDCGDNAQQQSCTRLNCDDASNCDCMPGCVLPGCGNGVLETYAGEGCDEGSGNCDNPGCTCSTTCAIPWVVERSPSGSYYTLNAVWTDGTVAWAVGDQGAVVYRNATGTWNSVPVPMNSIANLHAIYAQDANNVTVVGEFRSLLIYDGTSWTDYTDAGFWSTIPATAHLTGIACWDYLSWNCVVSASGGTLYQTAPAGVMYTNSTPYNTSTYNDVVALFDSLNRRYVQAVGDWGIHVRARPDHTGWTPLHQIQTNENLNGIWQDAEDNVVMVGGNGEIYRSTGTWFTHNSNTTEDLYDVVGIGSAFYAVGDNGTIRRYGGTGLNWTSETALQSENLRGVAAAGSLVLAVGADGIVIRRP